MDRQQRGAAAVTSVKALATRQRLCLNHQQSTKSTLAVTISILKTEGITVRPFCFVGVSYAALIIKCFGKKYSEIPF